MATRPERYLSVCSGGGGLDLGLRLALPGARCVLYVERKAAAACVLVKGIEAGLLDDAPIWSDIFTLDPRPWRGKVDLIVGGIPCQPHSTAGKRLGDADERDLWPVTARLVHDLAPAGIFMENVPGILPYYWRIIRPDLQALGYEVTEGIFSAEEVGAPHLRERLFWLAITSEQRRERQATDGELAGWRSSIDGQALAYRAGGRSWRAWQAQGEAGQLGRGGQPLADTQGAYGRQRVARARQSRRAAASGPGETLGDAECSRRVLTEGCPEPRGRAFPPGPSDRAGWATWLRERPGTEPALPQSSFRDGVDGLARSDWLRVLGNGVVPLTAALALRTLSEEAGLAR